MPLKVQILLSLPSPNSPRHRFEKKRLFSLKQDLVNIRNILWNDTFYLVFFFFLWFWVFLWGFSKKCFYSGHLYFGKTTLFTSPRFLISPLLQSLERSLKYIPGLHIHFYQKVGNAVIFTRSFSRASTGDFTNTTWSLTVLLNRTCGTEIVFILLFHLFRDTYIDTD